jgi:polyisoprenoid-binding protein YceI
MPYIIKIAKPFWCRQNLGGCDLKTIPASCVALAMVSMAWAQMTAPPTYKIDTGRSRMEINAFKTGLFKALGHDHTIAAKSFSGTVQFDAGNVKDSFVALSIDSASLTVVDLKISEKDRSEVQATMEGIKVLNVPAFPRIVFHSTHVSDWTRSGDGFKITLTGKLNLHGVEKEVTFPVFISFQRNILRASGFVTIAQTDFDIVPIKAGGGTVRVKNQVKVSFDILAEKTS